MSLDKQTSDELIQSRWRQHSNKYRSFALILLRSIYISFHYRILRRWLCDFKVFQRGAGSSEYYWLTRIKCIDSVRSSHLPYKMHWVSSMRSSLPMLIACRVNSNTLLSNLRRNIELISIDSAVVGSVLKRRRQLNQQRPKDKCILPRFLKSHNSNIQRWNSLIPQKIALNVIKPGTSPIQLSAFMSPWKCTFDDDEVSFNQLWSFFSSNFPSYWPATG